MRRGPTGVAGRLAALAIAAVLGAGLVAGCGGGDDDDGGDGATTTEATTEATTAAPPAEATVLDIPAAADGSLVYDVTEVTAAAGEITLRSPNPSNVPHNIAVEEPEEAEGEVVQQGETSEITVDFPAGTYEYYCSVPGHRQAGMVGTLTVE